MATSPEEAREEQPENPPQKHSEVQPEEEEEEENKKAVTEENRPHESAKEDEESDSHRDEKKPKESVDDDKDDRNPRNVPFESNQLEPFLERLERDPKTQMSFWTGLENYRLESGVYPFDRQASMEDFLNNWLQVGVPWLDFQQTFQRLRQGYTSTGAAIGGNLNSLNPPDREVFLLMNKILSAYHTERIEKKRKIQETSSSTFSNKPILIGGSKIPPKEPEHPLKRQKTKMVLDTKLKLKQKMPEYLEKEEVKPRENPEVKKRENPVKENRENPMEEQKENPEENPIENPDEAWTNANFDTLYAILHAITDYHFTLYKFPYDDASDMEDFVKNWLIIDLSVSDCLEVIKRLKKYYKKQFWKVIYHGLFFLDKKQEQLYNTSDILWNMEGYLDSEDEGDKEENTQSDDEGDKEEKQHSDDEGDKEEKQHSDDQELERLFKGRRNVEWKRPRQLDFSALEYNPETRSMLPVLAKNSFEQGIGGFSDVMPVKYPVPMAMLWPPILPFQVITTGKVTNQQKAGISGYPMNINDPGGPNVQCADDPGKPHDENSEGGSEQAPDESKSSGEEIKNL
ncbi:hypothetical protein ACOSQ3_031088 [Xanthoceras sorbifolium]